MPLDIAGTLEALKDQRIFLAADDVFDDFGLSGIRDPPADDRILVNAVLPGTVDTPANRAAMPHADPGKWTKPAEIAAVIGWLVSPAQTVTSGALIPVGWT